MADPRTGEIRYVGVTFRGMRRLAEHISRTRSGGRCYRECWIRSLLNVGLKPTYQVVQSGCGDGWQEAERSLIAEFRRSHRLVNLTDGGEGLPGYIPTPELRRKWSAMRKGVKYAPGRVPAMKGRSHTPESREKIRIAGMGRKHTTESKAKLSMARKGKNLSPEQIEKLVKAHRGKKLTEEHRHKIAAATTNRKPIISIETGQIFASITEASKILGVNEASVYQSIRKGCRCKGNHFRLV